MARVGAGTSIFKEAWGAGGGGSDLESSPEGKALTGPYCHCASGRATSPIERVSSCDKMGAWPSAAGRTWYSRTWEGTCFPAALQCTLRIPKWTSLLPPRGRAKPGQSRRDRWWKRCWTELPGDREANNRALGRRDSFSTWKDYYNCLFSLQRKTSEVIWLLGGINTQETLQKINKTKQTYFLSKV